MEWNWKGCFTAFTMCSHPPPPSPPGGSLNDKGPCDAIVRKGVKYRVTSSECVIFLTSLDADLKVLALSDIRVTGNPRRLTNLRKANRNESTLRGVSSKWIALVDVHANKQMYTWSEPFSFEDFPSRMYNGPMKSNPVWANGGSRDTLPLVNLESVVVCMELLLFYRWHTSLKFGSQLLDLLVPRIFVEWWLRYPWYHCV